MFDVWWKALACYAIPLVATVVTTSAAFHVRRGSGSILSTEGWLVLLLGNFLPLGALFYTAARANRVDNGIGLGAILGCVFVFVVALELGHIGSALTAPPNEEHESEGSRGAQ